MEKSKFLVVGLGNPEAKYQLTRHNAGFIAADNIINDLNLFEKKDKKYIFSSSKKFYIIKPITYMNLSGEAILSFLSKYKTPTDKIIVFHDDKDIELGKLRLKIGGSSAGHNGIENIIRHIGNKFIRVRIGINNQETRENICLRNYVLNSFTDQELETLSDVIVKSLDLVNEIIDSGFVKAQNKFHTLFK